ncbi:MAG: 1-acyl-sn-glycerol-3-phosphate acyltransferase [Methylococcales bacterium]|nr:1-acyl-sn-glycerol-3-phosphate acyltransferase [Methylococcales bacterium]
MKKKKLIDIESLIASKNEKLLKWLPRFVIRYLKRILHQKDINEFIEKHKDKEGFEWCEAVKKYLDISYTVKNIENIPLNGKITLAMNHPLGGMDAIILIDALKKQRPDLKFIVNDLLMNLETMKPFFVGIDKHGKDKKSSIREKVKQLFMSENAVCIFPAGMVSRKKNGVVKDLLWKKTFVTYSKEFDRTIIPIHIDGKLSNFFYRLSNFREFLGIKANIEMLYLSSEMFKQKGKHFTFVVGEPIAKELLASERDDKKLSQIIKEKNYKLRNQL